MAVAVRGGPVEHWTWPPVLTKGTATGPRRASSQHLTDPCPTLMQCSGITSTMLKRAADATFDDRSRGQVMADSLVERVTGRPAKEPEP